jgi:hypothetical protein
MPEVSGVCVKRAIMAAGQFFDPGAINIETGHRGTRARKGRDRQPNIARPMTAIFLLCVIDVSE